MEQWEKTTIMVTVFAFWLEIRPLDSFLTAYLTGPNVNATLKEVSEVLTPIKLYTSVISTFLVFLLADYLRYKPLVVFNAVMGVLAYLSLIGSPSMFSVKISEIFSSLVFSCQWTYYGYLFARIKDKEYYQIATGCVKSGSLSGMFVSGLLGQIVVYFNDSDYSSLPYYSLAGMIIATAVAIPFPPVKLSSYFHVDDDLAISTGADGNADVFSKSAIYDPDLPKYSTYAVNKQNVDRVPAKKIKSPLTRIYENFKNSYSNFTVFRWSFWHVLGMTGHIQIYLYINILYTYVMDVSDNKNELLNGFIDSLGTMCAAYCSYKIGKTNVDWAVYGDTFLALGGLVIGLMVCLCYWVTHISVVYLIYVSYTMLVQSVFVIVISEIAKHLKDDCYILVLGFNAFLSNVLTSASSLILVYAGVSIPGQFLIYGGYFLIPGIVYGCAVIYKRYSTVSARSFIQMP